MSQQATRVKGRKYSMIAFSSSPFSSKTKKFCACLLSFLCIIAMSQKATTHWNVALCEEQKIAATSTGSRGDVITNITAKEKAPPTIEITEKHSQTCQQKYLLISTQRSGSTWTCNLFDRQDGITCGGTRWGKSYTNSEMLINYSGQSHSTVTWENYRKDLNNAFNQVCDKQPSVAIGFKLMYNQIPSKFMESGQFEQYMRENNIALIHLIREAKILKIASGYDKNYLISKGVKGGIEEHNMHSTNQSEIDNWPTIPKMAWDTNNFQVVNQVLAMEEESNKWQRKIRFMTSVPNFYLSYELLLSDNGLEDNLAQVVSFLMPFSVLSSGISINRTSDLLLLHSPRCSDRIENYAGFVEYEKVKNSNTVAACKMLEKL